MNENTIIMDTINLAGTEHMLAQTPGGPVTASPYADAAGANEDVLIHLEEAHEQGLTVSGICKEGQVLRLASPDGRQVKILALAETANASLLLTGKEGSTLSVRVHDVLLDRDQALAQLLVELTTNGWTFKG